MISFGWLRELGRLRIAALALLVLGGGIGGAFGLGLLGVPAVETVENRFTGVSENTTTVGTSMDVSNPNPIGVQLGGTDIDYTVSMNDVAIASGAKQGVGLAQGNTTLEFSTRMRNGRIPAWWATHVANGETTQVVVDANVSHSLLGGRSVSVTQAETVETDIVGQFNSTETRPVDADRPFVSDPVLYINETRGSWDRGNLTRSETPLDVQFDVYNPKPVPYAVTKIGYDTRMNGITVGSGATEREYLIAPGERETVDVRTVIQNDRLDQWWVSHLRRNQNTTMYIDFYLVVEAAGQQFRIDVDAIDYETVIETDIFGNKASSPTGETTRERGDGTGTPAESGSDEGAGTPADTPTDGTGIEDGGLLGDGVSETPTAEQPDDGGPLSDGASETPTDDGGLLDGTL